MNPKAIFVPAYSDDHEERNFMIVIAYDSLIDTIRENRKLIRGLNALSSSFLSLTTKPFRHVHMIRDVALVEALKERDFDLSLSVQHDDTAFVIEAPEWLLPLIEKIEQDESSLERNVLQISNEFFPNFFVVRASNNLVSYKSRDISYHLLQE